VPPAEPAAAGAARAVFIRNGLILGLLTALGPFAIDMYLPSMPGIGASLGTDADTVMLSLTLYFVSFAVGQIVFGPLSDRFGRKPPLYAGVALFLFASMGCALAGDIHTLLVLRLLEGLGGATGMVIARAMVRDLHSGHEEVRLLSLLLLVFSVSPLLAPLIGSFVIERGSWRHVFWFIAALSVVALALAALLMPETRSREARRQHHEAGLLTACKRVLGDRNFLALTFVGALANAGFFVFLSSSSFVFTGQYGLSPRLYSLVFSVNALAFFAGMQLSGVLGRRVGLRRVILPGASAYAAVVLLLLGLILVGVDRLGVVVSLLFLGYGFMGLMLPVASVLALEDHGDIAGTASSLMGTLQLVTGSLMMALSGQFGDGSVLPMVGAIAVCAVLALLLCVATRQPAAA
jgi:DHA1 family bicyclomycin/chloramphenicol resistance-like MFS transporter